MLIYLESYKASLTFSIDPECTYSYVYENTKFGHKHKYVQIILVLLNPGWYLCADGIMNSVHINEHLAMLKINTVLSFLQVHAGFETSIFMLPVILWWCLCE